MATLNIEFERLDSRARQELDEHYGQIIDAAADPASDSARVAAMRLRLEVIHLRLALRMAGSVSGAEQEIARLQREVHRQQAELARAQQEIARLRSELEAP